MAEKNSNWIKISPSQRMQIYSDIERILFGKYPGYEGVSLYMKHFYPDSWNDFAKDYEPSYEMKRKKDGAFVIDVKSTLAKTEDEKLLKIAIDLGVEVPNVLYTIPVINEILANKDFEYLNAWESFQKAIAAIITEPDHAIALANATLETIIKHILEDPKVNCEGYDKNLTLQKLVALLLKKFSLYPDKNIQKELNTIGSSLLCVAQTIEYLRSDKTFAHGKGIHETITKDPVAASFIVNIVSSLGFFIIATYEKYYNNIDIINKSEGIENVLSDDDIPF